MVCIKFSVLSREISQAETGRYLADEVIVMKSGEVVEAGSAAEILNRPKDPYTCRLLEAVPNFDSLK